MKHSRGASGKGMRAAAGTTSPASPPELSGTYRTGYDVGCGFQTALTETRPMREAAKLALWICILLAAASRGCAAEACKVIHGRAHYYCGDGNLRIWHIGTHHEYEPDHSSWDRVERWLEAGTTEAEKKSLACPSGAIYLYADFLICPTEPLKPGAVQHAVVKSATHRHYVHTPD